MRRQLNISIPEKHWEYGNSLSRPGLLGALDMSGHVWRVGKTAALQSRSANWISEYVV